MTKRATAPKLLTPTSSPTHPKPNQKKNKMKNPLVDEAQQHLCAPNVSTFIYAGEFRKLFQ
jgi:hypothetical protein